MKERGIIFTGELVRGILSGRKTQTRRLCNPYPAFCDDGGYWSHPSDHPARRENGRALHYANERHLRKGFATDFAPWAAGDHLWVKETWYDDNGLRASEPKPNAPDEFVYYRADGEAREQFEDTEEFAWRPSIFMPRWASRLTLEVLEVRFERLCEISEEDARAEGVVPFFERFPCFTEDQCITTGERAADAPYRASFAVTWDEINADRVMWKANPWIFAYSFRKLSDEEAKGCAA